MVPFLFNLQNDLLPIFPPFVNLVTMSFVKQKQTVLLGVQLFLELSWDPASSPCGLGEPITETHQLTNLQTIKGKVGGKSSSVISAFQGNPRPWTHTANKRQADAFSPTFIYLPVNTDLPCNTSSRQTMMRNAEVITKEQAIKAWWSEGQCPLAASEPHTLA